MFEAQNDDLTRGFTQLAAEMIALAEAEDQDLVYGAVTTGNAWNFGTIHRPAQQIVQDLSLYGIPNELETLVRLLVGLLKPAKSTP